MEDRPGKGPTHSQPWSGARRGKTGEDESTRLTCFLDSADKVGNRKRIGAIRPLGGFRASGETRTTARVYRGKEGVNGVVPAVPSPDRIEVEKVGFSFQQNVVMK